VPPSALFTGAPRIFASAPAGPLARRETHLTDLIFAVLLNHSAPVFSNLDGRAWNNRGNYMNSANTPFLEQQEWRKRFLYRGWQLEPIEQTYGSDIAITRSPYGYRVLCTPLLGMIDVDINPDFDSEPQKKEALANMKDWAEAKNQRWIVYETAAGLRMLRVDAPQPLDDSYLEAANSVFGADKLYANLCVEQNAFRMRISPKPYRIGVDYPGWGPYSGGFDAEDEIRLPKYIAAYEAKADQFRTCNEIGRFGPSGRTHYDLCDAFHIHEGLTGANDDRLPMEAEAKQSPWLYEPTDLELVAFNEVYRPHGFASDLMWRVLPGSFCNRLSQLEGRRNTVMAEWDRCQPVVAKWNGTEYIPAETMLKRYKAEGLVVGHEPLSHLDPAYDRRNCQCDYCVTGRKAHAEWKAKMAAERAAAPAEDDEDWFVKLAGLADAA
jgi:hypothetical protein